MLMRTDPFRELDRLTQQVLGTAARPAAMPMDAYRKGDAFYIHLDLPGIQADSITLTVEQNVLTVRAERTPAEVNGIQMLVAERPYGTFSRQVFLGETLDAENVSADYAARRPDADHPGSRGRQAPQHPGHKQRREAGRHQLTPLRPDRGAGPSARQGNPAG